MEWPAFPDNLQSLGRSPEFDCDTVPAALTARHALGEHAWARLDVLAGEVVFVDLRDEVSVRVVAGESRAVPPLVPHRVELGAAARLQLEFFREAE
ncbi:MAG: DUF1971 domain-containing protein [Planctomycetes bacterium]|nr:DUF1971 domain-containing protein [Planctomycetota bacterium]